MPARRTAPSLLLACTAVLLVATLLPGPRLGMAPTAMCLRCGETPLRDVFLNILLFVPFGMAVAARGWRGPWAALAGLGLSTVIELLQMITPGRVPSFLDIVANGLGALAGYWIVAHELPLFRPPPHRARRLGLVALLLAVAGFAFTAVALRRDLPPGRYAGEWTPSSRARPRFRGELLQAWVGPLVLPRGAEDTPGTLRGLLGDDHEFRVHIVRGPRRPTTAIAKVVDSAGRDVSSLWLRNDQVVFRSRSLATRLGLRTPAVAIVGGVSPDSTRQYVITARRTATMLAVSSVGPDSVARSNIVRLSPGIGWYLLGPTPTGAGPLAPWLSALWVAFWLAPAAWWLGKWRARGALLLVPAGMVVALLVAPLVAGVSVGQWWEWCGGLLALLLGLGGSRPASAPREGAGIAQVVAHAEEVPRQPVA